MTAKRSLGHWVNRLLAKANLHLTRAEPAEFEQPFEPETSLVNAFHSRLTAAPLDADLHFAYAKAAWQRGEYFLARSELQTAEYLGLPADEALGLRRDLDRKRPNALNLNHNIYYRLKSLADAVGALMSAGRLDVLDVGGGQGMLADFLPDCGYCLAEPSVNGISGNALPFADRSFDVVVCCHVLEHIPMQERGSFLDEILRCAKTGLILLNPFQQSGTHEEDRLRLVWELIGADWARDHLECTLPSLESVVGFAQRRGLDVSVNPNGTLTTSFAMVFVDHFSALAGQAKTAARLNRFLNEKFLSLMDSQKYPTGYLVCMTRPGTQAPRNFD